MPRIRIINIKITQLACKNSILQLLFSYECADDRI